MSDKSERLVNLTIALLESRRPMTLSELKQRTGFYSQSDAESARRMFERDKDDLRRLGVPIEVTEVAFGDELGYRVPRGAYELQDIDLTPAEVAALALAVHMTDVEGVRLALTKLLARAPEPAAFEMDLSLHVAFETELIDTVAEAVVSRRPLVFSYRSLQGVRSERRVDPYAVVQRKGSWYLVAHDHGRSGIRAFRLDRIIEQPTLAGPTETFEPPPDLDIAAAVSGPEGDLVDLEIAVDRSSRWLVEARGAIATGQTIDGREVLRVPGFDLQRDRAWLLGLAPGGRVISPEGLAESIQDGLRAVLEAHARSASR